MKRIRIFFASSITDLRFDRIEIGNFFRQLNDVYIESGVYFELAMCEDYDNGVALEGKQSELDKLICDSELVFFVFFKKVGEYTKHEFEIALENFKSCKRPKIVTYFKTVDDADEAVQDVSDFMNMLDTELRHYYNIYKEIDTLKLGMLMQIKLMRLDNSELSIEGGKVMHGKTQIAETKNIPMFECNDKLNKLKAELSDAEKKYVSAKVELLKNGTDEAYLAFSEAATKKEKAEKALKELEANILATAERMYERTTDGTILSEKQKQAYRHMEKGEWELALAILDKDEILTELSHNEKLSDGISERIKVNTNELLQRIEVRKASGLDKDSIEEILSIYKVVYDTVIKYNLDLKPICEYAGFVHELNHDEDALKIIEKLSYLYSDPERDVSLADRADLLFLQAKICVGLKRYEEAIEIGKKGIKIADELFLKEGAAVAILCGDIRNISANAMYFKRDQRDALTHYENAMGYYEMAYEHSPNNKSKSKLAMIYDNYGIILEQFDRYEEAIEYHKKSEELYYQLANEEEKYKISLARCYHNTALSYKDIENYKMAESYLLMSIEIREEIRQKNPATIEPHLSGSYYSLAFLYKKMGESKEKVENSLNESKRIRTLLRKRSSAYASDLKYVYWGFINDSYGYFTEDEQDKYRIEYIYLLLSLENLTDNEKEILCSEIMGYLLSNGYEKKDEMPDINEESIDDLLNWLHSPAGIVFKHLTAEELESGYSLIKRAIDIYLNSNNSSWCFDEERALEILYDYAIHLDREQEYNEYKEKLNNKQ